jgi:hypothetical protein
MYDGNCLFFISFVFLLVVILLIRCAVDNDEIKLYILEDYTMSWGHTAIYVNNCWLWVDWRGSDMRGWPGVMPLRHRHPLYYTKNKSGIEPILLKNEDDSGELFSTELCVAYHWLTLSYRPTVTAAEGPIYTLSLSVKYLSTWRTLTFMKTTYKMHRVQRGDRENRHKRHVCRPILVFQTFSLVLKRFIKDSTRVGLYSAQTG